MMNWQRKKTVQTSSLMPNVSLKKLVLRFKKTKDSDEPESENGWFCNWMHRDEDMLYNSDNRLNVSPASSSSFKKVVSNGFSTNGRTIRELVSEERRFERIKMKALKDQKSRKWEIGSTEEVKKIVFESKAENCLKSKLKSTKKMNEIMLKNEDQRKFVDGSKKTNRKKSTQGCKVNAYTPRTLYRVECRIKAVEDMKRARMKMNKKREIKDAFRTYVDSFAILKRSFDPEEDFRESMMEMMMENGMRKREELEELLACYLRLNCDEYHDLIVKVFKDVWLELNQVYFDPYF